MNTVFEARDLWRVHGVPYFEDDVIVPTVVTAVRTMLQAATLRLHTSLVCDAEVVPE